LESLDPFRVEVTMWNFCSISYRDEYPGGSKQML
jgi:hypothetical protein